MISYHANCWLYKWLYTAITSTYRCYIPTTLPTYSIRGRPKRHFLALSLRPLSLNLSKNIFKLVTGWWRQETLKLLWCEKLKTEWASNFPAKPSGTRNSSKNVNFAFTTTHWISRIMILPHIRFFSAFYFDFRNIFVDFWPTWKFRALRIWKIALHSPYLWDRFIWKRADQIVPFDLLYGTTQMH